MTTELPPAVIVDVDGTLTVRRFGGPSPATYWPAIWDPAARTPYEWTRVGEDPPSLPMLEVVHAMHHAGFDILVTSGRPDTCRAETTAWLERYGVPFTTLLMATAAESAAGVPDAAVKRRIYEELILPCWQVVAVFDDRDSVVAAWRNLGLWCAQVGPGTF